MDVRLRESEDSVPAIMRDRASCPSITSVGLVGLATTVTSNAVGSHIGLVVQLDTKAFGSLQGILRAGGDFTIEPWLRFVCFSHPSADPKRVGLLGLALRWSNSEAPHSPAIWTKWSAVIPESVPNISGATVDVIQGLKEHRILEVCFACNGQLLELATPSGATAFSAEVVVTSEHLIGLSALDIERRLHGLADEGDMFNALLEIASPDGLISDPELNIALFGENARV